ncbi:MAG: class I SAM-dependent methyltransferase, partial [Gammaproteobacteria bacterium]|nr:class I SAM-dependent methyltransferase [Gammaproteobacteria bacterium]
MKHTSNIVDHYTSGALWDRLREALLDDQVDPECPTIEALAPYDQFHGRGLEATQSIAQQLTVAASDHLLDVGSGIGGPARYFAQRFGCRITGIDLTAEFCDVARRLNALTGLHDHVTIERGDALSMPFATESFDGAYSMNVAMNIEDKAALYREIHRVLRPGAWLLLSEIAQGPKPGLEYPTPWARTAASSFLATPEQTQEGLEIAGFGVTRLQNTLAEGREFGARSRAIVDRGGKPPHRAVALIHGD